MQSRRISSLLIFLFSIPCCFAQGALAHIATGGGWQTTITVLNLAATAGSAQITFISDSGTLLTVSPVGQPPNYVYTLPVPASGSVSLVLPDSGAAVVGWANIVSLNGNPLRGQGTFTHTQGGNTWEAAVPLTPSAGSNSACIIPLPSSTTGTQVLPFDGTANANAGIAIANITAAAQAIPIEFDDENDAVIATDTLNLGAQNHTSFLLQDHYPALAGHKGMMRLKASSAAIAVLGIRVGGTGGVSTLFPVSK